MKQKILGKFRTAPLKNFLRYVYGYSLQNKKKKNDEYSNQVACPHNWRVRTNDVARTLCFEFSPDGLTEIWKKRKWVIIYKIQTYNNSKEIYQI